MKRKKARVDAAIKSVHGKKVCQILDTCVEKAVERIAQKQSVASDKEIRQVADSFAKEIGKVAKDNAVVWLEDANNLKVMPQGIRFWAANGDYEVVVVEQPPQLRTLGFSSGFASMYGSDRRGMRQKSTYTVALPFVYFVIGFYKGGFNSLAVGYRSKPIKGLADTICQTNLPNMGGENLGICLGGFRVQGKTLAEKCNSVIQRVWCSQFTTDSADQFRTTISKIKSLRDWEDKSRKDSLFILDVPFKRGAKLQRLIHNQLPSYRTDSSSVMTKVWMPFHAKVAKAICDRLKETATSVGFSPTQAIQKTLCKEFSELYDKVYEDARKDGLAAIEKEKKLAQAAKQRYEAAERDYRQTRTTYVKKSAALSARERRIQLREKKLAAAEETPLKTVKKKAVRKKVVKKKAAPKKLAKKKAVKR
jgi:hypothetical protein